MQGIASLGVGMPSPQDFLIFFLSALGTLGEREKAWARARSE